jgi:hypothetical protein
MIDMIASGHKTERSTVAALGGEVRGRNVPRRPLRMESTAVTSEPYTGGRTPSCQAGQNVSVSGTLPVSRYSMIGCSAQGV